MAQVPAKREGLPPVPMASGQVGIQLSSVRNTEADLRWRGAQWVMALNMGAVVGFMYRLLAGLQTAEIFVLSASAAIIVALNYEWYNVLRRDGQLLDFWNDKLVENERVNGIDGGIKIFTSAEYLRLIRSRNRLQRKLERVTVAFIYFWGAASIALFTWACTTLKGAS